MKTAIQSLERDHEYILALIAVMEEISSKQTADTGDIETIIRVIKNFADGLHHAKEETLLFPAMEKYGFSREHGPVAVMLSDHDQGRMYVKGMNDALQAVKGGNSHAWKDVYEHMLGYGMLLRTHISKENNVLFRMAEKALPENEKELLLEEFVKVENSHICGNQVAECMQAIEHLTTKYNVNVLNNN